MTFKPEALDQPYVGWQDIETSPSFQNADNERKMKMFDGWADYSMAYLDKQKKEAPESDLLKFQEGEKKQAEWIGQTRPEFLKRYTIEGMLAEEEDTNTILETLKNEDELRSKGFSDESISKAKKRVEEFLLPQMEAFHNNLDGLAGPSQGYTPDQLRQKIWEEPNLGDHLRNIENGLANGFTSVLLGTAQGVSSLGGMVGIPGAKDAADWTRGYKEMFAEQLPSDPRMHWATNAAVSGVGQAPAQLLTAPVLPVQVAANFGQMFAEDSDSFFEAEKKDEFERRKAAGILPDETPYSAFEKTLSADEIEELRASANWKAIPSSLINTVGETLSEKIALKGVPWTKIPYGKTIQKKIDNLRKANPKMAVGSRIFSNVTGASVSESFTEAGQGIVSGTAKAIAYESVDAGEALEGIGPEMVGGAAGGTAMSLAPSVTRAFREQALFEDANAVVDGTAKSIVGLKSQLQAAENEFGADSTQARTLQKAIQSQEDEAHYHLSLIGGAFDEARAVRGKTMADAKNSFRTQLAQWIKDNQVGDYASARDIEKERQGKLAELNSNVSRMREGILQNGDSTGGTLEAGVAQWEANEAARIEKETEERRTKAEAALAEFVGSVDQDGPGKAAFARVMVGQMFPDFAYSEDFQDDATVTEIFDAVQQGLVNDKTDLAGWLQAPATQTAPAAAPATTPATQGPLTTGQRRDAIREVNFKFRKASPETQAEVSGIVDDARFWAAILNDKDSTEQDKAEAMDRLSALDNALLELATNPNQVSSQSTNPNDQNQTANQTTLPTEKVSSTSATGEGAGTGIQTIRATNADGTQTDYSQEDYAAESRGIVKALESGKMTDEAALQNVEAVRMEIEAAPDLTPEQKAQWLTPFQNIPALVEQRARAARTPEQTQTQQAPAPATAAQSTEQITDEITKAANSLTEEEFVKWAKGSGYAIGDNPTIARLTYRSRRTPEQITPTTSAAPVAASIAPESTGSSELIAGQGTLSQQPTPARLNGVSGDVVRTEAGETVFRSAIDGTETVLRVKEGSIDKDPATLTAEDFESGDGTPLVSEADKQFSVLPQNDRLVRPFFRSEAQPQSPDGQTVKSTGSYPVDGGSTPSPATPDIAAITADVQANPDQHRSKQGNRKLVSREAAVTILSQLPETLTNKDVATLAKDSGMSSVNFRKLVGLRGDQNAVGSLLNGDMDAELGLFDRATKVPLNETTLPQQQVSNDTTPESTVVGQSSVDRWVNDSFAVLEQAAGGLPQSSINAALFREKLTTDEGRAEIREKLGQMFNTVFRNLKISDPVVREEAMEKIFRGALQKQTGEGLTSNVLQDLLANLKKTGDPFLVKSKNGEVGYSAWLKHRNKQDEFMKAQGKRDMTETLVENEGASTTASQGVQEEEGEGSGPAFTEGDPDIEAGKAEARSMIQEATQRSYERISREIAKQYGLDWETVRVAIAKHFEKTNGIKQDFDGLGWAVPSSAKIKKATDALEAAMPAIGRRLVSEMTIAMKSAAQEAKDLGLLKSDAVEISGTPTLEQIIELGVIDEINNPDFYNAINEAREKKSPDALVPLLEKFSRSDITSLQVVTGIVLNSGKPITNKEQLASLNKADMQEVLDSNLLPVRLRQTLQALVDLSGEDGLGLVRNSKNEGFRRLAELYTEQIGNRAPVEVVFNFGLNPAVTGQGFWASGSNRVHISPFLTREKGLMEATILHEVMHPIWDRKITDFLDGRMDKLTANEQKTIAELQQLFGLAKAEAAKRLDSITDPDARRIMERNLLGAQDLREFLNEALNHRPFQDFLNEIKDPNAGGKTSVWRSILNKILELIRGGKVSLDSVLQRSFELSVDLANYTERQMPIEQRNPKQIDYFRQLERQKGRPLTPREAELAAVDFALQYPQPRLAETREEANRLAGEILSEGELANYNHELRTEGQSVLASETVPSEQRALDPSFPGGLGRLWQEAAAKEGGDAFAYGEVSPEIKNFGEVFENVAGERSKDFSFTYFTDGVDVPAEQWDDLARNNELAELWVKDPEGGVTVFFSNGLSARSGIFAVNSAGTKTEGSGLYQSFYAWAHNNGKIVGPDSSLSEIAQLRRTSQMLSSALRFGTTQHMKPSYEQGLVGWRNVEVDENGTPWEIILRRGALGTVDGLSKNSYNEFHQDVALPYVMSAPSDSDDILRKSAWNGYEIWAIPLGPEEAKNAWAENIGLLAKREAELVFERIPELSGLNISKDGYLFGPDEEYPGSTRALPAGNTDEYLGTLKAAIRKADPEFARRVGPATLARALATRFAEANNSNPSLLSSSTEGSSPAGLTFSPFKEVLYSEAVPLPPPPTTPMPMSAVDVLYKDSSVLPKSPKKIKNAEVATLLAEVALSHWGFQLNSGNITPEIEQILVTNGVDEFINALQASGKNAGDWYSTAIEVAMGVAGTIHPEISDAALAKSIPAFSSAQEPDKAAQLVMRIALAVTSQNLNVSQNAGYAEEQYAIFSSTGRFDSSKVYGEKAESISGNLELANQLIETLGFEGAEAFIKEEFSIADLQKKASAILGRPIKIAGKLDDTVNGAALFGPKIGQGFLQNLMGRFDPVTIDLWMRRTWGRWTGDVVGDGVTEERMARLLDAARDAGLQIPKALQSLRTVERKRKNGKPFRTMSEAISERLENDPEFRQSIADLAAEFNSRGQGEYRLTGQPVTPEVAASVAAGEIPYKQFIREQQRIKDGLDKKWDDLRKAGKKPAMSKADWVTEQHKEAGRTEELSNEVKGSLKPDWSRSAKVIVSDLNPIDIPSPQDRRVITRIVNKIREELSNKGYTATNADVQAVLWYPEKDIWAKLRGEEESNLKLSYDDEFIAIAEERGLGEQARAVAERTRADRAARTGRQNDPRANEATDQGADGFQTPEILASAPVTAEQDADYLAAVERGDMETAQRMVDEAAKRAGISIIKEGPDYKIQYGGSSLSLRFGEPSRWEGVWPDGVLNDEDWVAVVSAVRVPKNKRRQGIGRRLMDAASLVASTNGAKNIYLKSSPLMDGGDPTPFYERLGYEEVAENDDGAPIMVKSADPVTYDDAGSVIPLSERFNSQSPDIRYSAPVPFQGNVLPGLNPTVYTPADARKTTALGRVLSDPEYRSVQAALNDKRYFAWTEAETLTRATEFIDQANGGDLQKAFINSATAYGLTPEQTILVRGLALKRAQAAANAARAELANPNTSAKRMVNLQFVEQHYSDLAEDFAESLMETASLAGQELRSFRLLADALVPKTWANTYKKAAQRAQVKKFAKDPVLKDMMARIKAARQNAANSTTVRMQKALAMAAKRFMPEGTTDAEIDAYEKFARLMASNLSVREEVMQAAVEQTVVSGIETIRRAVAPGETIPDSFLREWENRLRKIATDQINAVIEQRLQGGQVDPEARELSEQEKEAEREQKLLDMWREFSDYPLAEIVFNLARSTIVASDSPYANLVRKAQFDPERIKNLRKAVQASINTAAEVRKSVADRRMSVEALKLRLAEANPSLNEAQLGRMAAAVEAVYNEEVARATRVALDEVVRRHSEKKTAKAVEQPDFLTKLLPLVNMGAFSDEAVYNAVADKLRLPTWNPAVAAEIEAKANALQALPEGSLQRQEAAQGLMSDILKANIKEARGAKKWGPIMQISSALWSAGILSGPPTQIVNASMSTVSVLAESLAEATGYWAKATLNGATQAQARAYFGDIARAWLFAAGKDANNTSLRSINEVHNALTKGQSKFKSEKLENMSPLELFKFPPRVAIPGNKMMDAVISGEFKTAIKEATKMAVGVPVTMAERAINRDAKGAVKDYMATMKLVGRLMLAADAINSFGAMATKEMMMRRYLAQEEGMAQQEIDRVMREARQGGNEAVRDAAMAQAEDEAQRGDFGPVGTTSHEVQKARRIEQLIEQQVYDADTINAGRDFAAFATFNNEPYGVVGWLMDTLFAGPTKVLGIATKPINPFPKTVSNLVNSALNYTPYGSLRAEGLNLGTLVAQSRQYPQQFFKEAPERGTPEYYALHTRAAFGTAAMGVFTMMLLSAIKDREEKKEPWFEIHGPGPSDPAARKQWAASGAKKFSLKIGTGDGALVLNYADWPALNLVLGVLGTFYDEAVYGDLQTDPLDWLSQSLRAVALTTLNRNFLGGAAGLFEILSASTPDEVASMKMGQLASSYATGFTRPSFVRWAETIATGTRQETSTTEGWLLSMTPVVSAFRDRPALNILGEPIGITPWDATAGRVVSTQQTHPILTPLTDAQLWINPAKAYPIYDPKSETMVRDMTKAEFYDYGKAYGEALKTMLPPQQVSALAELSKTAPNTAQEMLNNLANTASNIAKAQMAGRGLGKGKEFKGP